MLIQSATFITSMTQYGEFAGKGLPEIAIVGRSNVGKSSLINALTNRLRLARTSSAPGKTRLINAFDINGQLILVDLPGYGFAKVPREEKARWARMIEGYLAGSDCIALALALVDMRHEPTDDDVVMVNYLRHYGIPFRVVATKADKLSRAQRGRNIPLICRRLVVQPWEIIPFSSTDGTGKDDLLALFASLAQPQADRPKE